MATSSDWLQGHQEKVQDPGIMKVHGPLCKVQQHRRILCALIISKDYFSNKCSLYGSPFELHGPRNKIPAALQPTPLPRSDLRTRSINPPSKVRLRLVLETTWTVKGIFRQWKKSKNLCTGSNTVYRHGERSISLKNPTPRDSDPAQPTKQWVYLTQPLHRNTLQLIKIKPWLIFLPY